MNDGWDVVANDSWEYLYNNHLLPDNYYNWVGVWKQPPK